MRVTPVLPPWLWKPSIGSLAARVPYGKMISNETATTGDSFDWSTPESSSPGHEQDSELDCLSHPWIVIAVLLISVVILTTTAGNVLVILFYCKDAQVRRQVHNLYLLHLAVSDLLVGVVSMPLYLVYTACRLSWPLGGVACKVFLVEDYTCSTMSTLVVVLIAADRLALVRLGAHYTAVHTRRRAYVMLSACWALAFLLYSPAILLWEVLRHDSAVTFRHACETGFRDEFYFTLVSEGVSFCLPFSLLTIINLKLLAALRNRNKVTQVTGGFGPQHRAEQGRANGHHELRHLLGMVNHLAKFGSDLAETTQPLRELLKKDVEWTWDTPQEQAFQQIKVKLSTAPVLAHCNAEKPTKVSADASSYGLGGALLQKRKSKVETCFLRITFAV